jgi:hypothetical protein
MRKTVVKAVVAVVAAVAAVVLASCGGDDASRMTPSAATELDAAVHDVRAAVDARDDATATSRLAALRTTVADLVTTGGITPTRAMEILDAITALETQLAQRAATSTTTTAPTTTTTPPTTTTSTTTTRAPTTTARPSTTTSTTTTTTNPDRSGRGHGNGD